MRESGTTLIELMVSLALISIVFLAAGPLIVQSIRLFDATSKKLRDPDAVLVGAWLRQDVHSAVAALSVPVVGKPPLLSLSRKDGMMISYEFDGHSLIRQQWSPSGKLVGRQLILPNLVSWSFVVVQGCVQVQVVVPSHIDPMRAGMIRDQRKLKAITGKTESFCFSLRGRRGGRSW